MSPRGFEGRWWPHSKLAGVRVVGDDPDARELMEILLTGGGAAVEVTGGAREGFDAFLRERPWLIVSDIDTEPADASGCASASPPTLGAPRRSRNAPRLPLAPTSVTVCPLFAPGMPMRAQGRRFEAAATPSL